jgi:hypothetical protein
LAYFSTNLRCGARFAGAGSHHHQCLALVVHLESFAYPAHGAGLVIAFDNAGVDNGIRQLLAAGAALNQQFQLRFLEEALNGARRIAGVIPKPMLIAIGIKNHRALAVLGGQTVGIEFGLLLSNLGIPRRVRLASINASGLPSSPHST